MTDKTASNRMYSGSHAAAQKRTQANQTYPQSPCDKCSKEDEDEMLQVSVYPKVLMPTDDISEPSVITISNRNPFPMFFKVCTTNGNAFRPQPTDGRISPHGSITVTVPMFSQAIPIKHHEEVVILTSQNPFLKTEESKCHFCKRVQSTLQQDHQNSSLNKNITGKCSKRISNQHIEDQNKLKASSCENCKQCSPANHTQQQKEVPGVENSTNQVTPLYENFKHLTSTKHLHLQNQGSETENGDGDLMSFCERCKQYSLISHIRVQHKNLGTIYVPFCNSCKQFTSDNRIHRSQNVLGTESVENESVPFRQNCKQHHGLPKHTYKQKEAMGANQYPKSQYQTLVKHICACQNHVTGSKKQFGHKQHGRRDVCAEQPVADHAVQKCKFCYAKDFTEPKGDGRMYHVEQSERPGRRVFGDSDDNIRRPHIMTRVMKAADNLSTTDCESHACSEHCKGRKRTRFISENDWKARRSARGEDSSSPTTGSVKMARNVRRQNKTLSTLMDLDLKCSQILAASKLCLFLTAFVLIGGIGLFAKCL